MTTSPIFERIRQAIDADDVVLFMKGNQRFPQCGFSATVVQVLKRHGVRFSDHNVLLDADLRDGIKQYSDWPTIPQLYVKGEFIGGCDIVRELHETGELADLFRDKGVPTGEAA